MSRDQQSGGGRPPRLNALLLKVFLRGPEAEFMIGDLHEDYARTLSERGRSAADEWYRHQVRDTLRTRWIRDRRGSVEAWQRDLRRAARSLVRAPGFSATTVMTLALGLGGAAAVTALALTVRQPLPYPDGDQLISVWETRDGAQRSVAPANYLDWRERSTAFQAMAAVNVRSASVTVDGVAERGRTAVVSGNFFQVLGADAVLGRTFDPALNTAFPGLEAVLSHESWQAAFGGDPAVVGRSFLLDETRYEVVGVAPPGITYPEAGLFGWVRSRTEVPEIAGFSLDMSLITGMRDAWYFQVLGRLTPGTSVEIARQEMAGIALDLEQAWPESNEGHSTLLVPLAEETVAGTGMILLALGLAVILVLLAAAVNVAHLVWARSAARSGETAVRVSLGAGGRDLIRPFAAEGAVIGVVGAGAGLVIAQLGLNAGAGFTSGLAAGDQIVLGWQLSGAVLAMGALAGAMIGALGFMRAAASDSPSAALREARGGSRRSGRGVVIAQVAAAIALLGGSALLGRSVQNLSRVDPGFEEADLVTLQVALPDARSRPYAERIAVFSDLQQVLSALPGVGAAGFASSSPLTMGLQAGARIVGQPADEGNNAGWQPVSPGYFDAVGMQIVRGRGIEQGDVEGGLEVGVISEAFAREILGLDDPIGAQVTMGLDGHDRPVTVVGVVADTRTRGPTTPAGPVLYRPAAQTWRASASSMFFAVRGPEDRVTVGAVQQAVRAAVPGLPVYGLARGEELSRPFRQAQSQLLGILLVFAVVALTMGLVGIYGVTANSVTRRRREIGVRIALGADPGRVVGEVVGGGLRSSVVGVPIGIGLTLLLGRALSNLLFEVGAFDPLLIGAVVALVLIVTTAALLIPALGASRTNPATATRME